MMRPSLCVCSVARNRNLIPIVLLFFREEQ